MYCKNCGKPVEGTEELCPECKNAEQLLHEGNVKENAPQEKGTSLEGFGKALASAILGVGSYVISMSLLGSARSMHFVAMVMLVAIEIAMIVLAIVYGAKSLQTYINCRNAGRKKPVPAFALGIVGIVVGGISAIFVLIFLFMQFPQIVDNYFFS